MTGARTPGAASLRLDRAVVFTAFLLLGALALTAPLLVGISGMRITGCSTGCSTSLVGVGGAVIIVGCIVVTVLALVGALLLSRPDRLLWWLPCSALAVSAVIVVIGSRLMDRGVGA